MNPAICTNCEDDREEEYELGGTGTICEGCRYRECGLDIEDYGDACVCGEHRPVAYRTVVEMNRGGVAA